MVSVLGELLELGPAGAETSAQGGLGVQPVCPEDVESFYSEGECFVLRSSGPLGVEHHSDECLNFLQVS